MPRKIVAILCLVLCANALADALNTEFGGHAKTRLIGQTFPGDSIFNDLSGDTAVDLEADLRLNLHAERSHWSFDSAYQLITSYGDRTEYSRLLSSETGLYFDRLPNDDRRLFDLTSTIRDRGRFAALHRLDRLWIGYTTERAVVRLGRQAISWGNGIYFAPMDIVNPFDPTAVDTEYKVGDDMLYGQYLTNSGDDFQGAIVFRRNVESASVESGERTAAIKYHGISDASEYDVLLAQSYDDWLLGIGGNRSIGGSVWRGDLLLTDSASGTKAQLVSNLEYSWVWHERNVRGALEYYFNGFGQGSGNYDPASLAGNPQLLQRLARGETYSLGRHYLAGGLTIEMTPLWLLSPNLYANLGDGSGLLQITTQNSLADNVTFLAALRIPVGPDGTEYGGIETSLPDRHLAFDLGIFAQLAWYF